MKQACEVQFSDPLRMGPVHVESILNLDQGAPTRLLRLRGPAGVGYVPVDEFLSFATKVLATERGLEYSRPPPGVTVATCHSCTESRMGSPESNIRAWATQHEETTKHFVYVENGGTTERVTK